MTSDVGTSALHDLNINCLQIHLMSSIDLKPSVQINLLLGFYYGICFLWLCLHTVITTPGNDNKIQVSRLYINKVHISFNLSCKLLHYCLMSMW